MIVLKPTKLTDKQRMIAFRNAFKVIPETREEVLEILLAKAVEGDIYALALAFILREASQRGRSIQEVFKYCEGKYLNSTPEVISPEGETDAEVH